MTSLLVLFGVWTTTSFAGAFDAEQFYNNSCYAYTYSDLSSVQCSQFHISQTDIAAFQNETFVISNANHVLLSGCTIEAFNENLVNKFPNATHIDIEQCSLNLKYDHSNISRVNTVLKTMVIGGSYVYGNDNATAFSMLTGLTALSIRGSYIENSTIDNTLFANNTNLVYLEISNVQLSKVDAKAFYNLQNLKTINITGTGLSILPYGLLQNNRKLKTLVLSNNNIEYLPLPFFPTSVVDIQINKNSLEVISSQAFRGLNSLSYLDLSFNSISVLSTDAFSPTQNLTYLDLHNNQIPKFERKHFSQSSYLKALFLYNNKFTTLPEDIFDDLGQLGIVVINPRSYYIMP